MDTMRGKKQVNKQDMIASLERKIHSNRLEAKHYHDKAHSEPESYAIWKELQGYYDGRAAAFEWTLSALEES